MRIRRNTGRMFESYVRTSFPRDPRRNESALAEGPATSPLSKPARSPSTTCPADDGHHPLPPPRRWTGETIGCAAAPTSDNARLKEGRGFNGVEAKAVGLPNSRSGSRVGRPGNVGAESTRVTRSRRTLRAMFLTDSGHVGNVPDQT